jgi:serine/threonine protein phosphatase PrpC
MEQYPLITCAKCGASNRGEARFCQKCGADLAPITLPVTPPTAPARNTQPPAPTQGNIFTDIVDEIEGMAGDVRNAFSSLAKALLGGNKKAPPGQKVPVQGQPTTLRNPVIQPPVAAQPREVEQGPEKPAVSNRLTAPTRMISSLIAPKAVGEVVGGYVILEAWPLQHSNYYRVRMERCPQGHANPGAQTERCSTCQAELGVYLMRETDISQRGSETQPTAPLTTIPLASGTNLNSQPLTPRSIDRQNVAGQRAALIQLSRSGTPGFLKLAAVFDSAGRRYAVSDYPGQGWQSLTQLNLQAVDSVLIPHWILTLGQALLKLGEAGFQAEAASQVDIFEPVVVANQQVAFADLSMFTRREPSPPLDQQITFLAQVLYSLASGKQQERSTAPRDYSDVPPPFRSLVARVDQNAYPNLAAFLDAVRESQKLPDSGQIQTRGLRQIAGYSTDTGKKRDHNEDFVGKYSLGMQQAADAPEVGLYLVADGMGGHQGGELASREVVRVILNEIQEHMQELQSTPKLKRSTIKIDHEVTAGEVLRQAVSRANEVLFQARQKIGSDRGTTLTAALVIGASSAVANVGDSRTYLWRDGNLRQITQDHSLVASMVAANMIRPDEVRSHPQRNQIYRTLGEKAAVEVDLFENPLRQGDRLMLCSDGLWEMVLDQEIQQIMAQSSNPQEACDRLIEAANLAGGEDNISVVLVWMA